VLESDILIAGADPGFGAITNKNKEYEQQQIMKPFILRRNRMTSVTMCRERGMNLSCKSTLNRYIVESPLLSTGFEYMMKHSIGTEEDEMLLKVLRGDSEV